MAVIEAEREVAAHFPATQNVKIVKRVELLNGGRVWIGSDQLGGKGR